MAAIPDVSAASLAPFVLTNARRGAEVHTDEWNDYRGLKTSGYRYVVTNIARVEIRPDPAHVIMPRVHRVAFP